MQMAGANVDGVWDAHMWDCWHGCGTAVKECPKSERGTDVVTGQRTSGVLVDVYTHASSKEREVVYLIPST